MSTREDLKMFLSLPIGFDAIGLEPDDGGAEYFCDPVGWEPVARLGCDGVHFILLPGDERVYCVDPSMGEPGTYVLPVAEDLRQFLSYVLYCGDANPVSQLWWLPEERFRALLEDEGEDWPGKADFLARKRAALEGVAAAFPLEPADPWGPVKALQGAFDPSVLTFSPEYYDVLGLEAPEDPDGRRETP